MNKSTRAALTRERLLPRRAYAAGYVALWAVAGAAADAPAGVFEAISLKAAAPFYVIVAAAALCGAAGGAATVRRAAVHRLLKERADWAVVCVALTGGTYFAAGTLLGLDVDFGNVFRDLPFAWGVSGSAGVLATLVASIALQSAGQLAVKRLTPDAAPDG